jgi:UDP-hydrolysing UDP-N-acetyl-D-glucosamine 2-epimerase
LKRYGNAAEIIREEGFEIAARVYSVLEGNSPTEMARSTGLGLLDLSTVLDNLRPDVVVTIADRYETLATAIAASYMNLPLAHIQGGEVTGSIDEKVRHAVTKLADLHFVATEAAARRVIQMGEDPSAVFCTGCPSIDLAAEIVDSPELDFDPFRKYGGVGPVVDIEGGYLVVLQHPVTTENTLARKQVTETLFAVQEFGMPALWFWPNVDAGSDGTSTGIRAFRELQNPSNIHFFKNMVPRDFLRLLKNCRCLVGNSSVGIRESAFLGVPVVNIGSRQDRRERGENVLDVKHDREAIVRAVQRQVEHGPYACDHLYGGARAGERIAQLLATLRLPTSKRWFDPQAPAVPASSQSEPSRPQAA